MRLGKVVIENIKSIHKFELDFKGKAGWHVILGDNGSGKSTILKCISLCLIGKRNASFLNSNYSNWVTRGKPNGNCSVEIIESKEKKTKFKIALDTVIEDDLIWSSTANKSTKTNTLNSYFNCSFGSYRSFKASSEEKLDKKLSSHINLFKEEYSFLSAIEWLKTKRFQSLEKGTKDDFLQLLIALNNSNLLPNNIKIKDVNSRGVEFINHEGHIFNLSELSDGYKSIMTLLFELLRQIELFYGIKGLNYNEKGEFEVSGTVLIDEIDIHLHPTWQTKIGDWFKKTFPNIQFIVTTHSPLICQSATEGTIWKIEHPSSTLESKQMVGQDYNRLVFGNVLEAYSTEGFGVESVTQSTHAIKLKTEFAELNFKKIKGNLSDEEKIIYDRLEKIFSEPKVQL